MTLEELLLKNPKLDLTSVPTPINTGAPILIEEALDGMEFYQKFNQHKNIDQTFVVRFTTKNLISWLTQIKDKTDEINIVFSAAPRKPENPDDLDNLRYTVIIWPFSQGKPATEENKITSEVIQPYNIGNRQPLNNIF